jgi:hypothetical protein
MKQASPIYLSGKGPAQIYSRSKPLRKLFAPCKTNPRKGQAHDRGTALAETLLIVTPLRACHALLPIAALLRLFNAMLQGDATRLTRLRQRLDYLILPFQP